MSTEPTPFNVSEGTFTVTGQVTHGYVLGVRHFTDDPEGEQIDTLVFGATAEECGRAAARLGAGGKVMEFGGEPVECSLIRTQQARPV